MRVFPSLSHKGQLRPILHNMFITPHLSFLVSVVSRNTSSPCSIRPVCLATDPNRTSLTKCAPVSEYSKTMPKSA